MINCEYCNITLTHQRVVLENAHCMFLQLYEPDIQGAGIIIPKQHCETVFDLAADEWLDTQLLLKEVKVLLDQQLKPDGYNVGWNCGAVGGQHIFHAHMHVIPRFADEPFAGKGIRNWFKSEENKRNKRLPRMEHNDGDQLC